MNIRCVIGAARWVTCLMTLLACAHIYAAPLQMQDEGEPPPPSPLTSPETAPAELGEVDSMDAPGMMDAPAPQPRDDDDQLLRGPEVPETTARTLVRTDAQGRFQRVEGRPEEAAITLLNLDPETREKARQAAADRRETLRNFLLDNLELVIASTDAQAAGDQGKARDIARQMRDRFDPQRDRDPALPAIAAVIAEERIAELHRLTDEYWDALIAWELRNSKDKSDAARKRVQDRVTFDMFNQEVRQAYERTLRPLRNKFDAIVQAVEPTDEQKQAIRAILHDYIRAGRLDPTPEQQQEAARRIYQALDDERRQKLFETVFNRL